MKLSGTVIKGDGYGKKLGFPTVNIDRDAYQQLDLAVQYGVYAGWVTSTLWDGSKRAGIVIGPDDAWGLPKLEAHIIDFSGNLYGELVTFHIQEFIRPFQEYEEEETLKADIAADIAKIKNLHLCSPES